MGEVFEVVCPLNENLENRLMHMYLPIILGLVGFAMPAIIIFYLGASIAPPLAYHPPWAGSLADTPVRDNLFRRLWGAVHGIDTRARYRQLTGDDGAKRGEGLQRTGVA